MLVYSLDSNWKYLAPFLHLTPPEISAIKEDGKDALERRKMMLDKWIEKNGKDATYTSLLLVCLEAEDKELATNICREVKRNYC